MAALSAAELQKRHELEGAPDPFPSLREESSPAKPKRSNGTAAGIDNSELAFPSLAPSGPVRQAASWGASPGGPRIAPAVQAQTLLTERFTVTAANVDLSGRDGRPATLRDAVKQMSARHPKVRAEASSSTTGSGVRETEFFLKSESAKELERAKRTLVSIVSPQASIILNAPASTIATIIGPKGASLKQIRDQTNVRIDIPRKDAVSPVQASGNDVAHASNEDEEEEPTVPITITGPRPMVEEAQSMLKAIIASKTSKTTQRIRDIPDHILPFILARSPEEYLSDAPKDATVDLKGNTVEREILALGDRELVAQVVEKIKAQIDALKLDLSSFELNIPKRQHRLLIGPAAKEILQNSNCVVIVPRPEEPNDRITVWGNSDDFAKAMQFVTQKAKSQHIQEVLLPGPLELSKQIVTYITRTQYLRSLTDANPGVSAYLPPAGVLKMAKTLNIDLVGDKAKVEKAAQQLSAFIDTLVGGTKDVPVDWLLHRVLIGKYAKKLKQFQDNHNVRVFFPDESKEDSFVLLVYDPNSPSASRDRDEKAKHLAEVEKELLKLSRDAADVKSELIPVEAQWHPYVAGKDGTTLNAIVGEDKALSIKIGQEAGGDTSDFILVRGASADVDRAVKEIQIIVENAKNELIDNSYSTEFEIIRDFVGRIVGSHGAAINKLRETLGVKIDFSDDADDKEKDTGKKKKAAQKAKVKIVGRKENVEEAKRRILSQVERLADETSETLKIPAQYHSSLIGQSGKYVIRLEEKYSVKITFPRGTGESGEGRTRELLKPDEVLIKGGRKGVASAKTEILEAVEFEKETNNITKFTVPTNSVARILGKGGANINEIKDKTGAQIDIDKSTDDPQITNITCRGTKKAIATAKADIQAIAEQVGQEVTVTLNIERRFHRSMIGPGGQGLRTIVTRCGGPSDPKQQANLIRFPHQSEPSDEIRLRGDAVIVKKLQQELEKIATSLRDRVVLYVDVPNSQHRALIGRNGQHLNDLQGRTGAQVQFPGSRSYNQVGEAENAADFKDADPQNLVKVSGTRAACEKAIKELTASIRTPTTPTFEAITDTVNVPLKYHHFISQQGHLFRTLRSFGVNVDQSTTPTKSFLPTRPPSDQATSARIDDADEEPAGIEWQIVPNYEDAEEGDSIWTLKARDDSGLEKAKKYIADAIKQAEESSLVGFLTLPDRSAFPRIVGAKGSNVSRLRTETGADITVSREDNTITIIGSEPSIEAAKEAILHIHANRGGRRSD